MTKGIRGNFTKTGIVCLALLLALGATGITYAQWSDTVFISGTVQTGEFNDPFSWVVSNDNGAEETIAPHGLIDPGDNGLDPSEPQAAGSPCLRYDKDVALTTVSLDDPFNITATLSNAYPCYHPTIFYGIVNCGTIPGAIVSISVDENAATPDVEDNIPELTVTVTGIYEGQVIDVGEDVIGDLEIHVEQSAAECHTYTIRVTIVTVCWTLLSGTPGYWQNWDQHYTCAELTAWLQAIDADSHWLVPDKDNNGTINCYDWDAIRAAGTGGGTTMYDRFIMHYCATRLNVEAGRQHLNAAHDVSGIDEYNYLGLVDPTSAKLSEIIDAIESKYDTSPSDDEFEIMKDICVALNELRI